jgi:hypothetical protein
MSFNRPEGRDATPIFLTGSHTDTKPLKHCAYHNGPAQEGGGVPMQKGFCCSRCWKAKALAMRNTGRGK